MGRRIELAPLWSLCSFDDDLLPESTSSEFSFNYVDISNVKTGRVEIPQQTFTIANAPSRARRLARPGDVVVSTVRTYLRAIAPVPVSTENLVFSTGFCVVRPHAGISDGRYIKYLLTADQVVDEIVADSTGTSYPATSPTKIARLRVPAPPLPTQRAIADYLDRETAEIDGMRADLDEMERLLNERHSALIQRLIDQRIDADAAPMSIAVAGHLGGSGLVGGQSMAGDDETGILKTSAISSGRFLPSQNRLIEAGQVENVPTEHFVKSGDLLFNRLNSPEYVGAMSYVGETRANLIFSDKIWRLFPGPHTDPKYLALWAKTPAYRKQVEFSIVGTSHSMQSLGYGTFQQFRVFLPPLAEQRRIADEIDRETAEIDSMLSDITKLRDLLAERRAAVISAAVTGQIDIPVAPTYKDESHA
ncbi:TPA: hypothetical protein JAL39_002504 [Corynebacterium striatum]|nr:restriction endonuclease subunit S [Corynebacterium striatum]OFT65863.1 hypothetical protein HMPREF3148_02110 [Corynebacterium sp. HMSC05D08]ATZ05335.1 hypothetical protein BBR43_03230 [Corynebacterium striatum]EGT5595105.1 hypothetical protein [Corynebacterium striatum]NHX54742.1 hypothetical protein [Corynebacterium striatum]NHY39403.1 hypothetical protein [Corynebacterium striatum]